MDKQKTLKALSMVSFAYSMLCSISLITAIITKQIALLNLASVFFAAMFMCFMVAYVIYNADERGISNVMRFIINAVCLPVTLVFFIISILYVSFCRITYRLIDKKTNI